MSKLQIERLDLGCSLCGTSLVYSGAGWVCPNRGCKGHKGPRIPDASSGSVSEAYVELGRSLTESLFRERAERWLLERNAPYQVLVDDLVDLLGQVRAEALTGAAERARTWPLGRVAVDGGESRPIEEIFEGVVGAAFLGAFRHWVAEAIRMERELGP